MSDAPAVPDLPDWCIEDEDDEGPNNSRSHGNQVDDDGLPIESNTKANSSSHSQSQNKRVKIGKENEADNARVLTEQRFKLAQIGDESSCNGISRPGICKH